MSVDQCAQLKASLKALGEAINAEVEAPNYGGCCIIAALVAEALEARGVPCEVSTAAWSYPPARCRKMNVPIDEWGEYVSRCHLVVHVKLGRAVYTWDSNGLTTKRIMPAFHGHRTHPWGWGMTSAEARKLYYTHRWNSEFCPSQIPLIEELVHEYLSPTTAH